MDIFSEVLIVLYNLTTWNNLTRRVRILLHLIRRKFRVLVAFLQGVIHMCFKMETVSQRKTVKDWKLSLFLQDLLSRKHWWWETRLKYLEPYMHFEEWMIGELYGRGIVKVKYVGSYRETITSLHYSDMSSDIDLMYIYKQISVLNSKRHQSTKIASLKGNLEIINSSSAGYVYLQLLGDREDFVTTFINAVSVGEFHDSLHVAARMDFLRNTAIKEMKGKLYLTSTGFQEMHAAFNRQRFDNFFIFKQEGPASNVRWNISGLPQIIKVIPMDMVFALHCNKFPQQAKSWKHRERPYCKPSNSIMTDIVAYGVDLVAKGSNTGCKSRTENTTDVWHYEWRLSFSMAERLLVMEWNETQKSCFRLIKTLRTDFLQGYGIKSYYLKNIMFWLNEETPVTFWRSENFTECLRLIITRIQTCCRSGNCPHYFIDSYNLMRHCEARSLHDAANICHRLLANLYDALWISDGLWFEIEQSGMCSYYNALTEDLEAVFNCHKKAAKQIKNIKRCFPHIFKVYYSCKVHKEITKYCVNSLRSPHYCPQLVLKVLWVYIRNRTSDSQLMDGESKLILFQVLMATFKSFKWFQHKSIEASRDFSCSSIIEESRKLGGSYWKILLTYDSFCRGNWNTCAKIVTSNYELKLKIETLNRRKLEQLNKNCTPSCFPIVFTSQDKMVPCSVISKFKFGSMAYYCPWNLFLLTVFYQVGELQLLGTKTVRDILMQESFGEQFQDIPEEFLKPFHTILKPFTRHLKERITSTIASSENSKCRE